MTPPLLPFAARLPETVNCVAAISSVPPGPLLPLAVTRPPDCTMSLGVVSVTRPPEFEVVVFTVVALELMLAVDELAALAAITPVL